MYVIKGPHRWAEMWREVEGDIVCSMIIPTLMPWSEIIHYELHYLRGKFESYCCVNRDISAHTKTHKRRKSKKRSIRI